MRLKNQMYWYNECVHVIIHGPIPVHLQECPMPVKQVAEKLMMDNRLCAHLVDSIPKVAHFR